MTTNEAQTLAQGFFSYYKTTSTGLNTNNFGAAAVGDALLYFEFVPQTGVLRCSALIYRFKKEPHLELLQGFANEAQNGTDAGGGEVDYQTENKGLFLTRVYGETLPLEQFIQQQQQLMLASLRWGGEVLDRVTDAVFQ